VLGLLKYAVATVEGCHSKEIHCIATYSVTVKRSC